MYRLDTCIDSIHVLTRYMYQIDIWNNTYTPKKPKISGLYMLLDQYMYSIQVNTCEYMNSEILGFSGVHTSTWHYILEHVSTSYTRFGTSHGRNTNTRIFPEGESEGENTHTRSKGTSSGWGWGREHAHILKGPITWMRVRARIFEHILEYMSVHDVRRSGYHYMTTYDRYHSSSHGVVTVFLSTICICIHSQLWSTDLITI